MWGVRRSWESCTWLGRNAQQPARDRWFTLRAFPHNSPERKDDGEGTPVVGAQPTTLTCTDAYHRS